MTTPTRRRAATGLLVLLLAGTLLACGNDGDGDGDGDAARPRSTTAPDAAGDGGFPVTVTADDGEVEIAAAPERIVSLSASLTELLFAMGAGDQVVAVDQYSDHPPEAPVTDLSGFRPNVEAIGGYEPDLVVVASDRDGLVDALTGIGVPTLLLGSPDGLDTLYEQVDVLGAATGHAEEAAALVEDVEGELEEIAASVPEREAPLRYYLELSPDLHSITTDTFVGEVLSLAGLESIADGVDDAAGGYPQLSTEHVLASDPEVVFLAHTDGTGQDAAEVATRAGWADLGAVEDGHVVVLDPDVSSRWGPRVVDLLRAVVDATAAIGRPAG